MRAKKVLEKSKGKCYGKELMGHEVVECVLVMLLYTALLTLHQKSVRAACKRGIFQG
jgi:hypothetical protein